MKKIITTVAAGVLTLGLAACGTTPRQTTPPSPGALTEAKQLTVVTHDSFAIPAELKERFAKESGYTVTYVAPGDGGALVNQLVLTKDAPLGDVVYGIDNTFAGRALGAGVLKPYEAALPAKAQKMKADDSNKLTPINFGDVCINADTGWFAEKKLAVPASLDDLAKPEYKDLLVVSSPASSSPGLAFLAATYGAKGDAYLDYWGKLKANGVRVVKGWTEAYTVEFSRSGKGKRPLVLSYATSPAFDVKDGLSGSTALLKTCFRQVEYAGVLTDAKNEVGARKFIDFMLSADVQKTIPVNMYMYPVADVPLPDEWAKFAPLTDDPVAVPAAIISANRDAWIKAWSSAVIG